MDPLLLDLDTQDEQDYQDILTEKKYFSIERITANALRKKMRSLFTLEMGF
jgi:hypothetical protein